MNQMILLLSLLVVCGLSIPIPQRRFDYDDLLCPHPTITYKNSWLPTIADILVSIIVAWVIFGVLSMLFFCCCFFKRVCCYRGIGDQQTHRRIPRTNQLNRSVPRRKKKSKKDKKKRYQRPATRRRSLKAQIAAFKKKLPVITEEFELDVPAMQPLDLVPYRIFEQLNSMEAGEIKEEDEIVQSEDLANLDLHDLQVELDDVLNTTESDTPDNEPEADSESDTSDNEHAAAPAEPVANFNVMNEQELLQSIEEYFARKAVCQAILSIIDAQMMRASVTNEDWVEEVEEWEREQERIQAARGRENQNVEDREEDAFSDFSLD